MKDANLPVITNFIHSTLKFFLYEEHSLFIVHVPITEHEVDIRILWRDNYYEAYGVTLRINEQCHRFTLKFKLYDLSLRGVFYMTLSSLLHLIPKDNELGKLTDLGCPFKEYLDTKVQCLVEPWCYDVDELYDRVKAICLGSVISISDFKD